MQLDWTILRSGEQIMYRLRGLYERYGYRRFKMSKFEEYDLYVRNKDFLVSDRMITFTDARGILMALKPDVTLSIIKNTRAEEAGPRKVYYNESVYRSGQGEETFQEIMRPQAVFELQTDLLLDAIVKADGRSIPDIFAAEGEDGFRAKETEQTARFGKENRQLLSCGGGVVKRPENLRALHQNGVVLFIDRPVEALAVGGSRPLSSSMEALRTMEAQRRPLYRAAADAVVPNTGTLEDALRTAMEALDEIFDS